MNVFKRARHLAHERLIAWVSGTTVHRPERTLVIIDMQDRFIKEISIDEDERDLVSIVCELIQYARQRKWAIVLVECANNGPTNEAILEAVKDYPHQATVVKSGMNGGREVIECINSEKTWSLDLLVCGIYGPECVSATVAGLFDSSDLVEVDVIADAVYSPYCSSSEEDEHGQQREKEVAIKDIGVFVPERNEV